MSEPWSSWGPLVPSPLTRALCALDDADPDAAVRLVGALPLSERSTLTLTTGPAKWNGEYPCERIDQNVAGAVAATGRSHLVEAMVARLPEPENSCATDEIVDAFIAAVLHRDADTLDRLFAAPFPPIDGTSRSHPSLPGKLPRSVLLHRHEGLAGSVRETEFFVRFYEQVRAHRASPDRVLLAAVEAGAVDAVKAIVKAHPHALAPVSPPSAGLCSAYESRPEGLAIKTGQVDLALALNALQRPRWDATAHAEWSLGLLSVWGETSCRGEGPVWRPVPNQNASALATHLFLAVKPEARPAAVTCALRQASFLGDDFFTVVAACAVPLTRGEFEVWMRSDASETEKALRRLREAPSCRASAFLTEKHLDDVLLSGRAINWPVLWAWFDAGAFAAPATEEEVMERTRAARGEALFSQARASRMEIVLPPEKTAPRLRL